MTPRPLLAAAAGSFVAALSTSLVAVSAPVIAKDLGARPADVSWVLTAYLLVVSCALALAGKAADVLGRRRVFLAGFTVFVLGSSLCAVAPRLGLLVAGRAVQGAGAAMIMAVGPALVTRSVPPARRARSLGLTLTATYTGLTLGPGVGGLLAAALGWHAVFLLIASAGAAAGVLAARVVPRDDDRGTASLDALGAALFAFALASLLLALKRVQDGRGALGLAAIGLALLAVFAAHAMRRGPDALLPLELFRSAPFALGVAGATLLYTVTFMLSWLLPFQLQRGAGLTPSVAGLYMMAQPATMALVAPVSGVVADRMGPRLPSVAGMLAIALGLAGVAAWGQAHDARLVLALVVVGIGAGLFVAPNSAVVMGAAPRDRQSTAAAMTATARAFGMTLGIAAAASLERGAGFTGTLLVASALALLAALLSAVRPV